MLALPLGSRGEHNGHNTGHVVLWQWEEHDLIDLHTLPCLSVCILTALEDTHSLCLSRSVLTLLPHDRLPFDLSTQMAHRQIKSRSDLSVFVPKVFLPRPFSFISGKAHTTQRSTALGFSLPFPQTCHETQQQTTKILSSDELTPSFWWACHHCLSPAPLSAKLHEDSGLLLCLSCNSF